MFSAVSSTKLSVSPDKISSSSDDSNLLRGFWRNWQSPTEVPWPEQQLATADNVLAEDLALTALTLHAS